MENKRIVKRHKNCGGFILPDMKNSFTGMNYGYCPKCGKEKLVEDDIFDSIENITLYCIKNIISDGYLLYSNGDALQTIEFESEKQANEFAAQNGIEPEGYTVVPNVTLCCDDTPIRYGKVE